MLKDEQSPLQVKTVYWLEVPRAIFPLAGDSYSGGFFVAHMWVSKSMRSWEFCVRCVYLKRSSCTRTEILLPLRSVVVIRSCATIGWWRARWVLFPQWKDSGIFFSFDNIAMLLQRTCVKCISPWKRCLIYLCLSPYTLWKVHSSHSLNTWWRSCWLKINGLFFLARFLLA